jgi:hypothetical protein
MESITFPRFNLTTIFKLRDKLSYNLIQHVGTKPIGKEFEKFVDDVYKLLPSGELQYSILYESCAYLLTKELTKYHIDEFAWRLAGNLERLKANEIVRPWQLKDISEWVPVQILAADKTKTIKNEYAHLYRMRVLAGSPCPMIISKTWPYKVCSFIASKLGFSKPWKDNPYRDGHELVNTRFLVEIDPKHCRGSPGFDRVHCMPSHLKWNKLLLKARAHIDPPCPYNFTHFCYQCPIGLDRCIASTHPRTYHLKMCSICNQETWHDPAPIEICISCKDKST